MISELGAKREFVEIGSGANTTSMGEWSGAPALYEGGYSEPNFFFRSAV
jgi:hypothetical protein